MSQVHEFQPTDDGSQDGITIEQREWTSQSAMTSAERNADTVAAVRQFANAENFGPAKVDTETGPRKSKPFGAVVDDGVVSKVTPFHPSPSLDPRSVEAIEGYEEFGDDLGLVRSCLDTA